MIFLNVLTKWDFIVLTDFHLATYYSVHLLLVMTEVMHVDKLWDNY